MAYRQAELFVAFLHDTNPAGFARMMNAGLDDYPFAEAVTADYETDLQRPAVEAAGSRHGSLRLNRTVLTTTSASSNARDAKTLS